MSFDFTTGALLLIAGPAFAGPLSPPSGPIGSTGRFGARIEVNAQNTPADVDAQFNITQPGSYYLSGDVVVAGFLSGIEITADDVTLDLNGYTVRPAMSGLDGVRLTGVTNTSVRNGVVRGFIGRGVEGFQSFATTVEGVRAIDNNGGGIRVDNGGLVRACMSTGNGGPGFDLVDDSVLLDSVASANGGAGVKADVSVVSRCLISNNTEEGIVSTLSLVVHASTVTGNGAEGIKISTNLTLTDSTITGNGAAGVDVAKGLTMRGCNSSNNQGAGVALADFGTIESCTTNDNAGGGMDLGSWITVRACTAVSNDSYGFDGFQRTSFYDCHASVNEDAGFRLNFSGIMRGCVADFNTGDGVVLDQGGGCLILNNAIANNSAVGIRVLNTSGSNRIEGNHLVGMAQGVIAFGSTNFVVRNSASGAAFNLGASVDYGQIFTNPGAGFLLDQPWANFVH